MTEERSRAELVQEIEALRLRIEEAEETLRVIGRGEVDAFVISGPGGDQVFTLKGAEQPYRVLVETMNEGAATVSEDGIILYCNGSLAAMLDMPLEKIIGTSLLDHVTATDQPLLAARIQNCTEQCNKDEIFLTTGDGRELSTLISCRSLLTPDSQGISVVVTDLTQQKRNEDFVAEERLARSIFEQAGEVILVCDAQGEIIRANRLAHQLCAQNPLLQPFGRVLPLRLVTDRQYFSLFPFPTHQGYHNLEVEYSGRPGRPAYFLLNASHLVDGRGRVIGYVVTLTDITERKATENALHAGLAEKEVLLKEIHHRVKNNMQVISSLVSMQAYEVADPALRAMYQDVIYRVRAMAMVHEKLYESADLARIDFADYARSLLGSLQRAQEWAAADITVNLELQPVFLPVNTAVPCGLIVNELFSNALKHAFQARQSGEMTVSLTENSLHTVILRVSDNGIGLPTDLDWRQSASFGLRMVKTLTRQLRANIEFFSAGGTHITLTFENVVK